MLAIADAAAAARAGASSRQLKQVGQQWRVQVVAAKYSKACGFQNSLSEYQKTPGSPDTWRFLQS